MKAPTPANVASTLKADATKVALFQDERMDALEEPGPLPRDRLEVVVAMFGGAAECKSATTEKISVLAPVGVYWRSVKGGLMVETSDIFVYGVGVDQELGGANIVFLRKELKW